MLLLYLCNQNALQKQLKAGEILPHDSRKSQYITVRKTWQSFYLQEPKAVTPYITVDQEEALVPESWPGSIPQSRSLPQAMPHFRKVAQPSQTAPGREEELVI